jgi:hydrogenase maturation protein HypF
MVEHGLGGELLGIACDGTGYGEDHTLWGGELLLCDHATSRRVAHFRVLPMPGAERAVHEPWRMALSYLLDAELGLDALPSGIDRRAVRVVSRMVERNFNCPRTSSVGRLFDAVSALCGVRLSASYEGQAAIELEWVAMRAPQARDQAPYPYQMARLSSDGPLVVDTRVLIRALVADLQRGLAAPLVARRFHVTLAAIFCELCVTLRLAHGLSRVVLAGGVFANALLVEELETRLIAQGFEVYRSQAYPAGDGGLSLGQLAIAAARDEAA